MPNLLNLFLVYVHGLLCNGNRRFDCLPQPVQRLLVSLCSLRRSLFYGTLPAAARWLWSPRCIYCVVQGQTGESE